MRKIALAVLLVLGIAVGGLVAFGLPAQSLVGYVAREFESQTGYGLRIDGAAKLSLWRGIEFSGDSVRVTEPKSEGRDPLLTAAQIRLSLPLGSVLGQRVSISEVALTGPVIRLSFTDSGAASPNQPAGARPVPARSATTDRKPMTPFTIERVTVRDGTVIYRQDKRDLQTRFEKLEVQASLPPDGAARMVANAVWDGEPVRITTESAGGTNLFDGRPAAFQTKVEAAGLLRAPVTMTGNLAVTGGSLVLADIKAGLEETQITGAASLDWSKPKLYISADLNVDRLRLFEPRPGASPQPTTKTRSAGKLWSDKQVDLVGLNMLDVSIKAQVRDLKVHTVRFGSAELTTSIRDGVMSVAVPKSDLYGGGAKGRLVLDASQRVPTQTMRIELANLQALPFLSDALGVTKVEGRMHLKGNFVASGGSVQSMVEGLDGNGEILFENGAIREVSMPGMAQSVMGALGGGQQGQPGKTEFGSISSTFEARAGRLRTDDLRMNSSVFKMTGAGTADLPKESVDFRVEPSISVGNSRAGRRGERSDNSISVPVTIRGPWANPQVNAELDKLLENPDALMSKLRIFGDDFMNTSRNKSKGSQTDDKGKQDGEQGTGDDMLKGMMKQFMR